MDRRRIVIAVLIFAGVARGMRADRILHSVTVTAPLQNPAVSECPMTASDGSTTMQYTTAAREENAFTFPDPLPAGAILLDIFVSIPTVGACQPSKHLDVSLNPDLPNLIPGISTIGTIDPQGSVSCPTPRPIFTAETIGTPGQMIFPEVSPYLRGTMNILQVVESGSGCSDVRIEGVAVTLRYYIDLPVFTFDLTNQSPEDERKVLMHKWRDDYDYFAEAQRSITPATNRDHNVLVRGTAYDSTGLPLANDMIYVRTADPPDPSPYLPAGMSHDGDNPYGWLNIGPSDFYGWSPVSTDGNGRFQVVMPMTPQFAGDNQELEASGVPLPYFTLPRRCTAALGCYASGTFTAWRRVYLEIDHMFRQGSFLRESVAAGVARVPVFDQGPFRSRNPVPVLFIHAPDGTSGPTGQFYSEARNVIRVTGGRRNPVLVLDRPLDHSYDFRQSPINANLPAGDAVGVFLGSADIFQAYPDLTTELFKTMYTDLKVLQAGTQNTMENVPYVAQCPSSATEDYCGEIAANWFDNRLGDSSLSNHIHLIAGAGGSQVEQLGVTWIHRSDSVFPFFSYTKAQAVFIWNATIAADVNNPSSITGQDPASVAAQVTTHELVHTFDVNPPASSTQGHCNLMASDGTGLCLMNSSWAPVGLGPGQLPALHNDPWTSSEYRRVRRTLDPLPLFHQPEAQPNP